MILLVGELEQAGEEGEIQLSWWTRNLKYELLFAMNNMCLYLQQITVPFLLALSQVKIDKVQ